MFSKKPKTQTGPACGPYAIANGLYLTNYIEKNEINPLVIQTLTEMFNKNESYVGEIFNSKQMQNVLERMIQDKPLKVERKSTKNLKLTQLGNDLNHLQPNEFAILPIKWGTNLHWIGVIRQYGKLKYYDNHTRSLIRFNLQKIGKKSQDATNVRFEWTPWLQRKIKKNKYYLNILARIGKHRPVLDLINKHLQEINIQDLNDKTENIQQMHYFLVKQASRKDADHAEL